MSAAEFLRYRYPILRTVSTGSAFSPLRRTLLPCAGRFRKVSLPSGAPSDTSRMPDDIFSPGCGSCWIKSGRAERTCATACREAFLFAPQPDSFMRDRVGPLPVSALKTSSSGPFRPLSRYRPELQTCSAIEGIRPVDGQRLPSAYPAAFAAGLKKGWLPSPFTVLPAMIVMIHNFDSAGRRAIPFSATQVSLLSYTPLSGLHWKPACQSSRKRHNLLTVCALLRAPPRGIPGYSLLSGGRQLTGDKGCALVCVPPARHCIFCLSAFRRPLARVPQGTHAGYPRPFPPMRAFRQLPLPKAGASQNGFHPACALSCGMAWRNSFFSVRLSRCFRALAPGAPVSRRQSQLSTPKGDCH